MTVTHTLDVEGLRPAYGDRSVIDRLDLIVPPGKLTAIVGARTTSPSPHLLTDLNRSRGTTVVMVLHDPDLAARYADPLVALAGGRLHVAGEPDQGLTVGIVRAVFRPREPRHLGSDLGEVPVAADRPPPHEPWWATRLTRASVPEGAMVTPRRAGTAR